MINIIVGSLMIVGTISMNIWYYFNGPILPDYIDKKEKNHFRYDIMPKEIIEHNIAKIENICHGIANEMGVKNLEFYYSNQLGSLSSCATSVYKKNILILTDLVYLDFSIGGLIKSDIALDEDEKKFIISHELSHLKLKHVEKQSLYLTTLDIILGGLIIKGRYKLLLKSFLMSGASFIGLRRYYEKQADLNACKIVGNQGGINMMKRTQLIVNKYKADNWTKYFINKNGDSYLDIFHPLMSTRLKYITNYNKN